MLVGNLLICDDLVRKFDAFVTDADAGGCAKHNLADLALTLAAERASNFAVARLSEELQGTPKCPAIQDTAAAPGGIAEVPLSAVERGQRKPGTVRLGNQSGGTRV